jgi:chromate reductase, NAD(P)H dehydrogenase (quinone)
VLSSPSKRQSGRGVRLLVFGASLRRDSANCRLAALAATAITENGGDCDLATMAEFDCPSYNQDEQGRGDMPSGAMEFRRRLLECDGFVISSPEYNFSMPGVLKNSIDWVSRFDPQPFNDHHALLISASPSMAGGTRGLWALRIPLEHLGARVYSDMFSLSQAHTAFDKDGRLSEPRLQSRFEANICNFLDLVEATKHYPCVKRAWVEYLGEHPDSAYDRVQEASGVR